MENAFSYFNGKRVLITGHTGFKGAWLLAILTQAGAQVKGYALAPSYENGLFDLLDLNREAVSTIGDIRDRNKLSQIIRDFQPEFVFHLAAQPLVRRSYQIPAETFDVNVVGTANLLEGINSLNGKCSVVVITTDKVYENKEQHIHYKETDTLGGYDPYSASKACTELVVSSFRNSFFNPARYNEHQKAIASARAGNVIGGGDWSTDRIIPDIIRSLSAGKKIDVRSPHAVRPWQHVLEPLAGYMQLAVLLDQQPQKYSRAYNFGPLPDDHLTVQELVEAAISDWGSGGWNDKSDPSNPHEAGLLKLDIGLALQEIGWKPRLNARDAVKWTIDWYKEPKTTQAAFTFSQINQYFRN